MKYQTALDMLLETEEYITADEYLERLSSGKLDPSDAEIVSPSWRLPWGGFKVKLKRPRYKAVNVFRGVQSHVG